MLDELLDSVTDRSRQRPGSSGGLLGKIAQLLGGDEADDRHDSDRRNRRDEDDRHAVGRNPRRQQERREFDLGADD